MDYIEREEQETVIEFYRDDDRMDIYTSDQTMITKLKKLVAASTEYEVKSEEKNSDGRTLTMEVLAPVSFLTLRSKRIERTMSDEQRTVAIEKMRQGRATIQA